MTLLLSQMETKSKGKKGGDAEPSARERQRRACKHIAHTHALTMARAQPWQDHRVFYVAEKATLTP